MSFRTPNQIMQRTMTAVGVVGGLVIGGAGLIGSASARNNANKAAKDSLKYDPTYKENPLTAQRLGMAQTMLNARMPGAVRAENNIYANQASNIANVNKVATSGADAIQAAAASQGQTNEELAQLSEAEMQDWQRRYGNYSGAVDQQINEQDKVYQDKLRKYGNYVGVQGAVAQNRANTWGEVSNMGFGLASLGMGMMGGTSGGNGTHAQSMRVSRMPRAGNLYTGN